MSVSNEIILEPESHIYYVAGKPKTSVTTILREEGLATFWNCDPWYLERGKAVHEGTRLIDIGDLNWDTVDDRIRGYLEAYVKFKEVTGWQFEHIEKRLYDPLYNFCGTPDRFLPLLDIKCGEGSVMQLAGYLHLLRANNINPGREGFFLGLNEDETYNLKPYKFNRTDTGVFICAVTVNNWKRNNL